MRFHIASAPPNARLIAAVLLASLAAGGCAGSWAYRQGQGEAKKGNWDVAVARLTRALQQDPKNIGYKIALENARMQASRFHYDEGRRGLAADNLEKAADELEVASKYDPGNKSASDDLAIVRTRIRKRDEERQRLADFEAMKRSPQSARVPVPVLSPRSPVPISLKFQDTGLEKIFQTLSKLSGVNIVFDEGYRDKRIPLVDLSGVTFQEALDQITFANRLFYKVLDSNTLIIVAESVQNRRKYDEQFLQTFYLQNADVNETLNLVKALAGVQQKAVANPSLGAISVVGTPDQLALVQRIIETNDKSRGEVMVEVSILEVNRTNLKNYGIELSNYTASSTFSPTGGSSPLGGSTTTGTTTTANNEVSGGITSVRAHLLSSLNLSDFVVSIPSTLLTRFLQTDSTARLLASPRLRAAEGKKTQLMIGTEVPVPITQFTSANPTPGTGGSTFAPATSFNYRNVGVNLELTPKVSAGGEITLELAAEFSLLGQTTNLGGQDLPTFLTRKVNGILRLRDGETNLIGGLVQGRESLALSGVFGLQSIPVLNRLLTSTKKEKDDFEILISITPHLVRAPKITSDDLTSLYTGTTEITKVKGARPPLFGPEEVVAVTVAPSPAPAASPAAPQPSPSPAPTPVPIPAPPDPRQMPTNGGPPALPVQVGPQGPVPLGPQGPVPEGPPMPPGPVQGPPGLVPSETTSESLGPGGPNASVLLSPSERMLRIGETGTVDVVLLGARGIRVVEVVVGYDPALVEPVEALAGSLLTMDGSPVGTERGFELGRARIRFTRTTGVSGSGAVTTLKIRALKPGAGWLRIESISLVDGGTVEQPAIPAPARIQVLPERFGGVR